MQKNKLKIIFDFLEEKENQNPPFLWKLINDIPLTEQDLNVKGNLDLSYTNITSLPEGLKVDGTMSLEVSTIQTLPEGLKVGGTLDLDDSKIKKLPKGLEVGENLYIKNTLLIKYRDKELREMIKPGFIVGEIKRYG